MDKTEKATENGVSMDPVASSTKPSDAQKRQNPGTAEKLTAQAIDTMDPCLW